jgi:hypothetical protein
MVDAGEVFTRPKIARVPMMLHIRRSFENNGAGVWSEHPGEVHGMPGRSSSILPWISTEKYERRTASLATDGSHNDYRRISYLPWEVSFSTACRG